MATKKTGGGVQCEKNSSNQLHAFFNKKVILQNVYIEKIKTNPLIHYITIEAGERVQT
jgi:hypothetical protein